MYHQYSSYAHPSIFGIIIPILFWVLIIGLIIIVVRRSVWRHGHDWHGYHSKMNAMMGGKSALDIVKERYAKGEINKQEFEEKKKDLSE